MLISLWVLVVWRDASGTVAELVIFTLGTGAATVGWLRWQARRHAVGAVLGGGSVVALGGAGFAATPFVAHGAHELSDARGAQLGDDAAAAAAARAASLRLPAGLDRETLVADAKRDFVRLQAAWDVRDLTTLRRMTTPSMLDELLCVLEARDERTPSRTDVVTLHAELLACEPVGDAWLASIEFTGLIRESADAGAEPFRELWLLARDDDHDRHGTAGEPALWRLARQQALL